jgi:hypothetical protein
MDLQDLTLETFAPHVGTRFRVALTDGRSVELELTGAARQKDVHAAMRKEGFAIWFRGPADLLLPQGTYHFAHECLGDGAAFFIVPIGRKPEGYEYEAIFS